MNTSFEYLCHLEVFQEALRMGAGRCVFYGKDPMTALLVGRACASMSVPFHCPWSRRNQGQMGDLERTGRSPLVRVVSTGTAGGIPYILPGASRGRSP